MILCVATKYFSSMAMHAMLVVLWTSSFKGVGSCHMCFSQRCPLCRGSSYFCCFAMLSWQSVYAKSVSLLERQSLCTCNLENSVLHNFGALIPEDFLSLLEVWVEVAHCYHHLENFVSSVPPLLASFFLYRSLLVFFLRCLPVSSRKACT